MGLSRLFRLVQENDDTLKYLQLEYRDTGSSNYRRIADYEARLRWDSGRKACQSDQKILEELHTGDKRQLEPGERGRQGHPGEEPRRCRRSA